jgi:ArsR family transcriptional regulator, arsenate/arsenite/antimonite-responsive transcriptional repressor
MKSYTEVDSTNDEELAASLLALSHPVRLAIIRHLALSDACCNKDVVARVGLAQSTVSQHLKTLVDAGFVIFTPDRQRSRYTLNQHRLSNVSATLGIFNSNACNCCSSTKFTPGDRKSIDEQ